MKYVTTQVFSFDEHKIDSSALQIVASELEKGKIVAFPTETVYGIGALENYPDAIDAIYELKGRSNKKPLAIYINNLNQVKQMKLELPSFFDDFVALFWPGPVTLLVQDVNKQKQGIRYADNCTVNSILSLLKHQLRGTSANESGSECLITAQDVYKKFKNKIDYIVDTGKCKYGTESTVLDVSTKPCIVIRKG